MAANIRELGVIGDQRTTALIDTSGAVVWYCPEKFDGPSLFASLLDEEKGGVFKIHNADWKFKGRRYLENSAILETTLSSPSGEFKIRDWMPAGDNGFHGIIREFISVPQSTLVEVKPSPNYQKDPLIITQRENHIGINDRFFLYSSFPLQIADHSVTVAVNQPGWIFLSEKETAGVSKKHIRNLLEKTKNKWEEIASHTTYRGIYEKEVACSIRAIRLLTYKKNGGIIAAPTTSLPEVPGGYRNYDYRYVWLRDSGMIVSALTRAGSDGVEERRFLDFICDTAHKIPDYFTKPLFSTDQTRVANETFLDFKGYKESRPVRVGNNANEQLQLDSLGNILLAAKLIYGRFNTKEHWEIIRDIANYLAHHWQEPDYGLWEENYKRQYTSSKVIVAIALEYISQYADSESQKSYWLKTSENIRKYIQSYCINTRGAYAVYAGSEDVDISAALFPEWGFTEADSPVMLSTVEVLEREYYCDHLYWRHLEDFDSSKEGAFLAGTFWMAQYWIMRNELEKAKKIIDSALRYSNDLGLFAEEADPQSGEMLGNFPQSFVHASFIGAVVDLKNALKQSSVKLVL